MTRFFALAALCCSLAPANAAPADADPAGVPINKLPTLIKDSGRDYKNCRPTAMGVGFRGNLSVTQSGLPCQRWDSQAPHKHTRTPERYPGSGLVENYCRNPDWEPDGPWCYTTTEKRWEYCAVEYCFPRDCKYKGEDPSYRGSASTTKSGRNCQRWDSQEPHEHLRTPENYKHAGLIDNFCRNPDGEPEGPWCYTEDKSVRWEYCDIPICPRYLILKTTIEKP